MKIIELRAENVKRLKAVTIRPSGPVVELVGRNGAGKSSVIDAIAYAIGGERLCPKEPIRQGQTRAEVSLCLGEEEPDEDGCPRPAIELAVCRNWTQKASYLTVTDASGAGVSSPQALLNRLVDSLSFDPLEFVSMRPAQQRDVLLKVLGVTERLAEIDSQVAVLVEERRVIGRDLDGARAVLDALPRSPADTPDAEIDTAPLTAEIDGVAAKVEARSQLANDAARTREDAHSLSSRAVETQQEIAKFEAHLRELRAKHEKLVAAALAAERKAEQLRAELAALPAVNLAERRAALAAAEQTNRAVAAQAQRRKAADRAAGLVLKHESLATLIERTRAEKVGVLRAAKWPIEGLGFEGETVLYNGVPFSQASASEQLRVSVAMSMAMNRELRLVFVRNGSLLDDESRAELYRTVAEKRYQLWFERVGGDGPCAILIEDGEVVDELGAGAQTDGRDANR